MSNKIAHSPFMPMDDQVSMYNTSFGHMLR